MAGKTGLALSGGGSKGDFEVGAVKYLLEFGIRPDIICGCSVGALNAARLAEGAGSETRLEQDWRGLSRNGDMWTMQPWVAQLDTAVQHLIGGVGSGIVSWLVREGSEILVEYAIGLTGFPTMLFTGPWTVFKVVDLGISAAEIADAISKGAGANAIFSLSPTVLRIMDPTNGLNPARIAGSGIKLRVGTVSLQTGVLHYFDENGVSVSIQDASGRIVPDPSPVKVDLLDAVLASASIPMVFPPIAMAMDSFVDGGVREMIPVQAAIDAGALSVFAIAASPVGPSSWQHTGLPPFLDIAARTVGDIMVDQILTDDLTPSGQGWPVPVTQISPTFSVHDGLTVDPGLIAISIDYGYMRAADVLTDPGGQKQLRASSDAITRLRVAAWREEHYVAGQPPPGWAPGTTIPAPDTAILLNVQTMKSELRKAVSDRIAAGGAVPANKTWWWRSWERHPFAPPIPSPWDRFVALLGPPLERMSPPPPIGPDPGVFRTSFSDYDGDGQSDMAIWRPGTGEWWIINSSDQSQRRQTWGQLGDQPVPGDYDGDGKTDLAIWRHSDSTWWVVRSSDGSPISRQLGQGGDIPVPGDYDGDGKADFAIWRPSTGMWFVINSSDGSEATQQWGQDGDIPVPGDFDGDGKTDFAVWRPATGTWFVIHSSDGGQAVQQWGLSGDVPVPGDYDGDSRCDFAIWRPGEGNWYVIHSSNGTQVIQQWGQAGDVPVPGDFDRDGKTDFAIWRPVSAEWWLWSSFFGIGAGPRTWGQNGDWPLANVATVP